MRENLFIFLMLLANNYLHAGEALQIVYRDEPIQVQLRVGSERRFMLKSAASVKVGIPESLRNKLSVTTIGSQVWLRANQSFEDQKIIFQISDIKISGAQVPETKMPETRMPKPKIILILSANYDEPPGAPVLLSTDPGIVISQVSVADSSCDIGMVALARYALQWAYAPRRLLTGNPCITSTDYPKGLIDIMSCLRVNEPICGGGVFARPIAAWRTTELYATLLELKNTLQTTVALDPRAIVGNFKAAALAHSQLQPADTAKSVTALVVISDKPLRHSIPESRWLDKTSADERTPKL